MRILAAFDKCKDSLNADELCSLSRSRIEAKFPDATVREIPQTDGGEGFASILTRSREGRMRPVRVSDSLGRPHEVEIGVLEISSLGSGVIDFLGLPQSGTIALVEMASSVGLSDLRQEERDPWSTGTRGVGECLLKCAEWGVDAILLGIGGSSTNDMGVGALRALGALWPLHSRRPLLTCWPLNPLQTLRALRTLNPGRPLHALGARWALFTLRARDPLGASRADRPLGTHHSAHIHHPSR